MKELKNIRYWIFDLDNTLYPPTTNLFDKIDRLMCRFIEENLNVTSQEALKIKDTYFHQHGTTLNGLMKNHKVDAEKFLEFVHDIDYSILQKDSKLSEEIAKLPGEKIIFTNGSRKHAQKVIQQLGIENNFNKIFDIVDSKFIPKPQIDPYHDLISTYDIDTKNSIFFEWSVEDVKQQLKDRNKKENKYLRTQNIYFYKNYTNICKNW